MAHNPAQVEKSNWVVVADESSAIIYARDTRRSPLRELFVLENPEARAKTEDRISDRGGRSFDSHGKGRHTMTKEKPGSERQVSVRFAKEIASRINRATYDGSCRSFVMIAAPRFLGILRQALAKHGTATPEFTIDKDVVGHDVAMIQGLLAEGQ